MGAGVGGQGVESVGFVECRDGAHRLVEELHRLRQHIAAHAGQGAHHIHPGTAELFGGEDAEGVHAAPGAGDRFHAEQRERLGEALAAGLDVVDAPQHDRHRLRMAPVRVDVRGDELLRRLPAPRDGGGGGDGHGVDGVQVPPRRQGVGAARRVAADDRRGVAPGESPDQGVQLGVGLQFLLQVGEDRRALRLAGVREVGGGELQGTGSLPLLHRTTHGVQAEGDGGAAHPFQFAP